MSHEITVRQQQTVEEPSIMQVVQQIIASPNAKEQVEVMRELLAMKERAEDREAKRAFADALVDLQAEIPPMHKDGTIVVKGVLRSKYVTMDTLDDVLRPLMEKYGFSFTLSEVGINDGMREFCGTISHRGGHEKTLSVFLPLDKSDFRSAVQSEGSTISYARRQLYKAHFNIIERGKDDDGSGQSVEEIGPDEAKDLEIRLMDAKANIPGFLKYFEISDVKELRKADLSRAYEMIERKGRK